MDLSYRTRRATPKDSLVLADMRRRMFIAMGKPDDDRMQNMVRAFAAWVADAISRGVYVGWVVETPEREPVANAGLFLLEWPPHLRDIGVMRGYILNVWTNEDHRRKGIARELMGTIMSEARRRNIRVLTLHASDEGKHVYEELGFRQSREMMYVEPD